ncbi:alanine racemase, partial [Streptococcus anginosus]
KLENIQIVGLMTMAPIEADEAELNVMFQQAYQLQQRLQRKQLPNMPFTDLSMGMSRDYTIAIANGSTFVRIGTAFFK